MSLLANSNAIESGGYNIQRSLRFRSSASAYLNRTPASTTNQKTFTFSVWVKRGSLGAQEDIITAGAAGNQCTYGFNSGDSFSLASVIGGVTQWTVTTSQVFRDPSAWYAITISIDTTQATAANRVKLYVNGAQVTAFSTATYPTQNYNEYIDSTVAHNIGRWVGGGEQFDGYLAEVNFIDGQALTPSSFGQTDAVTGVWTPKKYTGTYGTNGFYLPFSDNTSATTLAYDKSGNGNNWTANNISTTAGATYDSMTDVPTLTSATAANYCVLNPLSALNSAATYMSQANLALLNTQNVSNWKTVFATIGINIGDGKFYWETTIPSSFGSGIGNYSGIANLTDNGAPPQTSSWSLYWSTSNFQKQVNATGTTLTGTPATNDVLGIAYDAVNGQIWFSRNNTWFEGNPSAGTGASYTGISASVRPYIAAYTDAGGSGLSGCYINFGQRPFSYTPPTGFKALNTFNLPDPTIKKPNQYMDVSLWAGDGNATRTLSTSPNFTPDLYWIKNRTNGFSNLLYDRVRGAGENADLSSNTTSAEGDNNTNSTYGYVSAFTTDGFSIVKGSDANGYTNGSGNSYVGWQWKKGATPGFDIVTYTGNGSVMTIPHSLGVVPKLIISKSRTSTANWVAWHASLTAGQAIYPNLTNAAGSDPTVWNSTLPTSTNFTVGTFVGLQQHVAYLWAEIPGFSKFGSYTGNGSADGPMIYTGFQPKYVLIKSTNVAGDWSIWDSSRSAYNVTNNILYADLSDAEQANNTAMSVDFTSNGFKIRGSNNQNNGNGNSYIYMAFASNPFKYSLAH